MIPLVRWGENNEIEIHTVQALEQLIDNLTVIAKASMPFSIELSVGQGTSMAVVIGREECHIEFYSSHDSLPVVGCTGPWDEDDIIAFSHHGHYSELPKRYWIPSTDAREALRQYFLTGTRPSNLKWNDSIR